MYIHHLILVTEDEISFFCVSELMVGQFYGCIMQCKVVLYAEFRLKPVSSRKLGQNS